MRLVQCFHPRARALWCVPLCAGMLVYSGVISAQSLPEPVCALALNEGSGTNTSDYTVTGNDGTVENGAAWNSSGKYGKAVEFDGTAGNVDLGGLDISGSELTITAWFKADDFGPYGDPRIVSKADGGSEADHWWMVSTLNSGGQNHPPRYLRERTYDHGLVQGG